jgi:hypothetical protein
MGLNVTPMRVVIQMGSAPACWEDAAAFGIVGGTAYAAIIAYCALKANAQTIYTWNVKHLNRLGETIAARVRQP